MRDLIPYHTRRYLLNRPEPSPVAFQPGCGTECSFRKERVVPSRELDAEGLPLAANTMHDCRLDPRLERPLLCRLYPYRIKPPTDDLSRKIQIVCPVDQHRSLVRGKGERFIDQFMHNVVSTFLSVWPFLNPDWWALYEESYKGDEADILVGEAG